MTKHIALSLALSCLVSLSASPSQLQEFRMAAQIDHFDITCPPEFDRQAAVMVHELSHVFLFDVLPPDLHRDVAVWILEGFAEHQRGVWEMSDLTLLREMAGGGTLPTIIGATHADSRRAAVFGHAAFDFLASRAGADGARRFFTALRGNPGAGPLNTYLATIGLSAADFDRDFAAYLKGSL